MRGEFIHFGHRQCVDRTGFDAISAKHAFGDVDIELAGETLPGPFGVFLADDLDATGRTGSLAEIAAHTTIATIRVAKQAEGTSVTIRNRPLLARVLEGDGAMKHVLKVTFIASHIS